MRQVLLATYNFYPYNWGGSEIYVLGLAKHLIAQGDNVRVLAAMPESGLQDCQVIYADEHLKIGEYEYDGIKVIGCVINPTTEEIYSKYNAGWEASWLRFFDKYWKGAPLELLHAHGNTSLIGAALFGAIKTHFPNSTTLFTYHVADTCPKGTLTYFNKSTCEITPSVNACTACVMNDWWGTPASISKLMANIWVDSFLKKNMPAKLRPKQLTKLSLESFGRIKKHVDRWHVFSPQIKSALQKMGVSNLDIEVLRHGANDYYFNNSQKALRPESGLNFLFIGRFKKIKGLETLLKAWLSLEQINNRNLWIIGDGQDLNKQLSGLIGNSKLRNDVQYFGVMGVDGLKEKLEQAHCLIIPSEVVETGPLVFHEAMACGTNVIASDIGGCASLANFYGEGCEVFEPGNYTGLKQKIQDFKFSSIDKKVMTQQKHFEGLMEVYGKMFNKAAAVATA